MERVSIAFVGCGAVSHLHLAAVNTHNDKIFVSVAVDPDAASAARIGALCGDFAASLPSDSPFRNPTVQTFGNLDEALEANNRTFQETGKFLFVAVDLMIPHHLHHRLTIRCLNAGLHVLLEKPMAPTIPECMDILQEAKKSDKVFMVAENSQYWPEVVRAKELLNEGKIGNVITARAVYTEAYRDTRYHVAAQNDEWRNNTKLAGGGIALDGGSHWIRPLRMWLGEISEVVGLLGHPLQCMQGESLVKALFKFNSGIFASFEAIKADTFFSHDPWWRILGERGEIVISDQGIKLYTAENPAGKLELDPPQGYMNSFSPEIEDFASAVLQKRELAAGAEMSLGELRTALAIYKSATTNQWVKVWGE